jgi:hypothetical protein
MLKATHGGIVLTKIPVKLDASDFFRELLFKSADNLPAVVFPAIFYKNDLKLHGEVFENLSYPLEKLRNGFSTIVNRNDNAYLNAFHPSVFYTAAVHKAGDVSVLMVAAISSRNASLQSMNPETAPSGNVS